MFRSFPNLVATVAGNLYELKELSGPLLLRHVPCDPKRSPTASNNGDSVALTGGTIPANGSCTVTVNVEATSIGTHVNTLGTVTSTNAGVTGPATATLTVAGVMQQVPTLSNWALTVRAGLLAIAGGWARSRRRLNCQ